MFAVALAASLIIYPPISFHYCSEVATVLKDAVKRGSLKQRSADRILERCIKNEHKADG